METNLADRTVLVTGASGGIGGALGRAFAGEGARVVLHYHRHADRAEQLAHELGPTCRALGADLTNEQDVARLFTAAEQTLGPVQILVANAGIWPPDDVPIHQMSLSQ